MDTLSPLIFMIMLLLLVALSAAIGTRLGKRKGNSAWGASLGAFLGPLGWLIILLLPNNRYRSQRIPEHRVDKSASNVCKKCGASNPLLAKECASCGTPIGKR